MTAATPAAELRAAVDALRADPDARVVWLPGGAVITQALALPLADLLEREARKAKLNISVPHALAVARAVLAGSGT